MNPDRDHTYLLHILECIDYIREYTQGDRSIFMEQRLSRMRYCDAYKRWQNQPSVYQKT